MRERLWEAMVDLNLVRCDHVVPAGFVAITCARFLVAGALYGTRLQVARVSFKPAFVDEETSDISCTLPDGALPDGNIVSVGAKRVSAQPVVVGKGFRGNNGACSVLVFPVVCSSLLVLTWRASTFQSSLVTWFHNSPSCIAERHCGTKFYEPDKKVRLPLSRLWTSRVPTSLRSCSPLQISRSSTIHSSSHMRASAEKPLEKGWVCRRRNERNRRCCCLPTGVHRVTPVWWHSQRMTMPSS